MVYNFDQVIPHGRSLHFEFKAKCLALLEQVRKTKKPLRITRHGKTHRGSDSSDCRWDRAALMGSMRARWRFSATLSHPPQMRMSGRFCAIEALALTPTSGFGSFRIQNS